MFIDYFRLYQTHFGDHRVLAGGGTVRYNSITKEVTETLHSIKHEGSDSTFIQIRCDGKRVDVSGNVGRFDRPDNVFNYDLEQTMTKVNEILESLDIPPFTKGEVFYRESKTKYGEVIYTPETTGARFSEIHCTQNYSTGSSQNLSDFIYNAGMIKPGRQNVRVYPTGVTYGEGSRLKQFKVYNKGEDLRRLVKSGKLKDSQYIRELTQFCDDNGVVRFESMYRDLLRRNNSAFWGHVSHIDLNKFYEEDEIDMVKEIEIFDIDRLPRTIRTTYYDYINGVDLKSRLSNGTLYRHRKELLKYGYDILQTVNVQRLPTQTKIIKISPLVTIPDFYHMPDVEPWKDNSHLSLVKTA